MEFVTTSLFRFFDPGLPLKEDVPRTEKECRLPTELIDTILKEAWLTWDGWMTIEGHPKLGYSYYPHEGDEMRGVAKAHAQIRWQFYTKVVSVSRQFRMVMRYLVFKFIITECDIDFQAYDALVAQYLGEPPNINRELFTALQTQLQRSFIRISMFDGIPRHMPRHDSEDSDDSAMVLDQTPLPQMLRRRRHRLRLRSSWEFIRDSDMNYGKPSHLIHTDSFRSESSTWWAPICATPFQQCQRLELLGPKEFTWRHLHALQEFPFLKTLTISHFCAKGDFGDLQLPSVLHLRLWRSLLIPVRAKEEVYNATRKSSMVHLLLHCFPNLTSLETEIFTPLSLIVKLAPKLKDFTFRVFPTWLGTFHATSIGAWRIAEALQKGLKLERIILETGAEKPLGWKAAAEACRTHDVELQHKVLQL